MKPLFIVLAVLIVVVISLRTAFQKGPGSLSVKHKDSHELLPCGSSNPKKALIIYQPAGSGSTYKVIKNICRSLNDAGYDVDINTPGLYLPTDLSSYSLVAFGTPVYAGQISTVLVDYVKTVTALPANKTVLLSVGGVDDSAPELAPLKEALRNVENPLILKFNYKDENKNAKSYKNLIEMAKNPDSLS